MCGIAAILRPAGLRDDEVSRLDAMRDRLAHRGPDEATSEVIDGWAGLGHRRLSIIDTGGSRQPLRSEDGAVVTVFNGEIYNFVELRERLTALGHHFATAGDGETIVHGYEEWGDAVCERLDGIWAFVLVDRTRNRALIARDPSGIKPMFWAKTPGAVLFGSEIKAIVEHPDVPRVADRTALALGAFRRHCPWPHTAFASVHRLPPGARMIVPRAGTPILERYTPMVSRAERTLTGPAAVEAVDFALRTAVRRQLVADVPVGAFLSGGIDSTLVVRLMTEFAAGPVHTFSYADSVWDESPVAEATARRLGTVHHVVRMDELGFDDLIGAIPSLFDEPFAEASALGVRALSRLAGQYVKVALSGDGGDEVFAGYDSTRHVAAVFGAAAPWPASVRDVVGAQSAALLERRAWRRSLRRGLGLLSLLSGDAAMAQRTLGNSGRPHDPATAAADAALSTRVMALAGGGTPPDALTAAMWSDRIERLPNAMLTKVDVASMSASLEVRVPLLDSLVIDVGERCSLRELTGMRTGKLVLRRLLHRLDPQGPAWAKKQGFAIPVEKWWRDRRNAARLDDLLDAHGPRLVRLLGIDPRDEWRAFRDGTSRESPANSASRLLWFATTAIWSERFGVENADETALDEALV